MVMITWNFGVLEIWVAHEFGSVNLKLVLPVSPPYSSWNIGFVP